MAIQKKGSRSIQLPNYIDYQNVFCGAQILFWSQSMIVVEQERTVTAETNEEDSLVMNRSKGRPVLEAD